MYLRVLDLDGSVAMQKTLLARYRPPVFAAGSWGPKIRLGCRFGRFWRFEQALAKWLEEARSGDCAVTCYGSGDFHHVSLALLRRITQPFNLLVIDNHPDWMRGIPFLHCGTWVYHAARLPQVQRIFHVGGDVDFDNSWRWLAPWRMLRRGKIVVLPGIRKFERGKWSRVPNMPVRPRPDRPTLAPELDQLLQPFREELAESPLYISLDKDVMSSAEAVVNWDSGHLKLIEVRAVLERFLTCARGNLIGMDIVGDWSPVRLRGLLRRLLHWTEHPRLEVNDAQATWRNELTNLTLLNVIQAATGRGLQWAGG
jgi:hypothetical protein